MKTNGLKLEMPNAQPKFYFRMNQKQLPTYFIDSSSLNLIYFLSAAENERSHDKDGAGRRKEMLLPQ